MRDVATQSLEKAHYLARRAAQVPGVSLANGEGAFFREFVLRLPGPATGFLRAAEKRRILAGVPLSRFDRARPADLLVAATEKRTREEMDRYVDALAEWARHPAQAPVEEAACRS
jgi:glycine dehydrogenase subunit 1